MPIPWTEIVVAFFTAGTTLGFAYYKWHTQFEERERQEKQSVRRETIWELSEEMTKTHKWLNSCKENITNPSNNEDFWFTLQDLSKDVLAFHHSAGRPAKIVPKDPVAVGLEKNKKVSSPRDALDVYKNQYGYVRMNVYIEDMENFTTYNRIYDLSTELRSIGLVYRSIDDLESEYGHIVERSDTYLLNDLREGLDQIVIEVFRQYMNASDGIEFDPDDYETTEYLADDIRHRFVHPTNVAEKIDSLEVLIERFDDARPNVDELT